MKAFIILILSIIAAKSAHGKESNDAFEQRFNDMKRKLEQLSNNMDDFMDKFDAHELKMNDLTSQLLLKLTTQENILSETRNKLKEKKVNNKIGRTQT